MSKDYAKVSKIAPRDRQDRHSGKPGYLSLVIIVVVAVVFYYAFSRGILVLKTENVSLSATSSSTNPIETAQRKPAEPAKPRFEFYTLLSKETVPVPHEKNASADVTTDTLPKETEPVNTNQDGIQEINDTNQNQLSTQEPAIAPTGIPSVPVRSVKTITQNQTISLDQTSKQQPISSNSSLESSKPIATPVNNIAPPSVTQPTIAKQSTSSENKYILQVAALKQLSDADRLKAQLSFLGFDVILEPFQSAGSTWYRVKVGPYTSLTEAQKARQALVNNHMSSILITLPTGK